MLHLSADLENLGAFLNTYCDHIYKISRHAQQCKIGRSLNLFGSVQPPSLPLLTLLHLHADLAVQGPQVPDIVEHPY